MSETTKKAAGAASQTIVLVAVLIGVYVLSQFFRNSIGVIAPDLAREFRLDAAQLSALASFFFLSFALVQIPLGMAIDRFGPKICLLVPAAITLAGTVLFALARGYTELLAARLIIGLGCSSFLMAPLAIYAQRFPPRQFGTMVGIQVGAGNLGALGATAPLAAATGLFGWRASFLGIAAMVLVAIILVALLVHDDEGSRARRLERAETVGALFRGVVRAGRIRAFWPIFLLQMTAYPAFASILGLWSGPWLEQVYGFGLGERGNLLFVLSISQVCALFAWGFSDRIFSSYKIPCTIGAGLCAAALAAHALFVIPKAYILPYFVLLGVVFGFSPALTSHGKAIFPPELIGRGLSLLNIGAMGGVFVQQSLTGFVIGLFESKVVDGAHVYPPEAYRWVFGLLAAEIFLAMLFYQTTRDAHPAKE